MIAPVPLQLHQQLMLIALTLRMLVRLMRRPIVMPTSQTVPAGALQHRDHLPHGPPLPELQHGQAVSGFSK